MRGIKLSDCDPSQLRVLEEAGSRFIDIFEVWLLDLY